MNEHSERRDYIFAVGMVTVNWAMLETALDCIVAVTFNGLGGHPKHHEIPRSLSRKITYFRDIAENDNLARWRREILSLADDVELPLSA